MSNHNGFTKDRFIGSVILGKYTIMERLGEGSFGIIYSAFDGYDYYAIKVEDKNGAENLLETEAQVMSYLKGTRIPHIKEYETCGQYNLLIMELMGKSLENLFSLLPDKRMSIRSVCNIGIQMIEILEEIHSRHVVHRDIKPDNFVIGRNDKSKFIYLLDFGLATKYRSSTTLKHYPMCSNKKLTGTARYASINALNGGTQSRRDDLESVGYVLMFFLRGKLPWQGLTGRSREDKYSKIMEKKRATTPDELCSGFPCQFRDYIKYTRELGYEEEPDYNKLKKLFYRVLAEEGYSFDYYYDWDHIGEINNAKASLYSMNYNNGVNSSNNGLIYSKTNLSKNFGIPNCGKENMNINLNNEAFINSMKQGNSKNSNYLSSANYNTSKNKYKYYDQFGHSIPNFKDNNSSYMKRNANINNNIQNGNNSNKLNNSCNAIGVNQQEKENCCIIF